MSITIGGADVRLSGGLVVGPSVGVQLAGGGGYTYYVDSVNGNDANDGRSEVTAFATIGALPELVAGQSVGLARGSHWREQLTLPANNILIGAYGSGARPILDGSDILSSGGWTDSAGRADANTNVYSRAIATASTGTKTWINIYEDDSNLAYVTSLANCQSTAGSYYVSSHTSATPTVYIHPTGGGNPASNGKVYEVTTRLYGINADTRTGIRLTGITTRRNLHENGSTAVFTGARLTNCRFEDGSKHNVIYRENSILTDCVAENSYYGGQGATLFVLNQTSPTGLPCQHIRCQALNTIGSTNVDGFYAHINTSGEFGDQYFEDCDVVGCDDSYNFLQVGTVTLDNCRATGFLITGVQLYTDLIIRNGCQFKASSGSQRAIYMLGGTGQTLDMDDSYICVGNSSGGAIYVNGDNATLNIDNCIIKGAGSLIYFPSTETGLVLNSHNNLFDTAARDYDLRGTSTINSDDNQFNGEAWVRIGVTEYNTLAAYQAASDQDANSAVGTFDSGAACA